MAARGTRRWSWQRIALHVVAAAWVVFMLWLAAAAPGEYRAAVQEDRFIEWWTAALFAAAAAVRFRGALPERRWFDLLVALFCVFVAGEEFSWGQRLVGFTPPEVFLARNTQQELTLHNFADVFGRPKGVLTLALLGYGLLPLARLWAGGRRLLERVGATPPPVGPAAWLVAAALLLVWYPVEYTGEWVEALAGGLFLVSGAASGRGVLVGAGVAALAAVALSAFSAHRDASPAAIACAEAEARALLEATVAGDAARPRLARRSSVHKRIATSVDDGYLDRDGLWPVGEVECPGLRESDPAARRRHFVDPWGMAYWIRTDAGPDGRSVRVYSMGPNRRRDAAGPGGAGDDIILEAVIPD